VKCNLSTNFNTVYERYHEINGKLWTLALGFKEGLSLGDRTSAQSTLLTWGVNSVWSNLNKWREE
jgi:hypothetical protein